jgi:5-methylcytosine-specific restriction endonuclease McrA
MAKASKLRQTTCPVCGKIFTFYPSWPRTYCSHVCAGKVNASNTGKPVGTRYQTTCEECGKTFSTVPSQAARFCSQTCFGRWNSEHIRGDAHPTKGRTYNRPKHLVALTCPVCQEAFQVKASHAKRRRFCSKACMGAWQAANIRGEANFHWKGGYEPYYGPNWRKQRRAARERDKYTCQRCGKQESECGKELDVHHVVPFRVFGFRRYAEANKLTNLVSLCAACHLAVEHAQDTRPNP